MSVDGYITLAEYATLHNITPCAVRRKCLRGNVPGAVKVGRDWLIPADAPYDDKRVKSGKYVDWRKPQGHPDQE